MDVLFLGAPIAVFLLGAVAALRWVYTRFPKTGHSTGERTSTRLAAAGVEELTAFWYGSKRDQLDHRAAQTMLRDEESDGAPPRDRIDLAAGQAVLVARPPHQDPRS
ncbi:DUF6191 domain-containing protein [Nocardia grenadensis]|uniref:DUF6191 domain-containing protein n=1 Tax=Nocardia grenadensis TaxID=931537 RepID=UPI003D70F6BF